MDMPAELLRFFLLEDARNVSEANYAKDPFDADNLTRWGSVLLQLSHFQDDEDTKKMIEDAISKLEEALVINPIKHHALWLLGNCFANQALMASDLYEINGYKDKASACYQKALHEDPGNENYIRSLELFTKAPEKEKDIHANAKMDKDILTNGEMDKDILTNGEMDKDIHTNEERDKDILTNGEMDKEIHTNEERDKDIHTHAETNKGIHTNALDQKFICEASSQAKGRTFEYSFILHATKVPEKEKDIHAKAKMDKDILTNGEMDKEIHTNAEIDMKTHTNAETDKGIHTNAFDQQFICDASPKAKLSNKKSGDLKQYAIFGWIILAAGIVAWAGMAKPCDPLSPPR